MSEQQAQLKEAEYKRAVGDLQSFLRRLSHTYVTIPYLVSDGIFGERTKAAVEEFQRLMGMPGNGSSKYPDMERNSERNARI